MVWDTVVKTADYTRNPTPNPNQLSRRFPFQPLWSMTEGHAIVDYIPQRRHKTQCKIYIFCLDQTQLNILISNLQMWWLADFFLTRGHSQKSCVSISALLC